MTKRGRKARRSTTWGTWQWMALLGVVVLAVAGIAALAVRESEPRGPPDFETDFSLSSSPRQGLDSAPVKLFAFESPQCSSCRFFHIGDGSGPSTYQRIIQKYVETGKVQYVEKTFYVGYPWEARAAYAQKCLWHMAPEKFHLLTTAYYANQTRITVDTLDAFLGGWAQANGVDRSEFLACTDDERYKAEANRDVQQGRRAGARGTPTFVVIGPSMEPRIIAGPQSFTTFERAFEDAGA